MYPLFPEVLNTSMDIGYSFTEIDLELFLIIQSLSLDQMISLNRL
jgi:hypothetical protein